MVADRHCRPCHDQGGSTLLIESGLVRVPHRIARIAAIIATSVMALAMIAGDAYAQVVEITPPPTESPSSKLAPGTQWVYWMAIGAGVIVVLILLVVAAGYMRFAPKFFGREESARPVPPGTRPPTLARQAAQMRYAPPPAAESAAAPTQARARTATAVAERPAAAPAATAAPADAGTERTTAPPSGEPAVQADVVGQAETEAPEERPTVKTAEEVGSAAAQTQAPSEAPAPAPQPAATAQPAVSRSGGGEMDQETFDRVLKEQLDRGVDRRVAEGRARAAAVVAARKKAQG